VEKGHYFISNTKGYNINLVKYFVLYHTHTHTRARAPINTHSPHAHFPLLGFRFKNTINIYVMAFKTEAVFRQQMGVFPRNDFDVSFIIL
jgi:hypothetical protein